MGNFAVLRDNNKVENIIVAETKEVAESFTGKRCVEYSNDTFIGPYTTWNPETESWFEDVPVILESETQQESLVTEQPVE